MYPPNHPPGTFPLYGIERKNSRGNEGEWTEEGRNEWSFTMPENLRTGPLPTGPIALTYTVLPKPKVPSCAQFALCDFTVSSGAMTDILLEVL